MTFFVPSTKDEAEAEKVYDILRRKLAAQHRYEASPDRIYELEYEETGHRSVLTVGKSDFTLGEVVVAIFRADDRYLVCTPNRGLLKGQPMVVGDWLVLRTEAFDPA